MTRSSAAAITYGQFAIAAAVLQNQTVACAFMVLGAVSIAVGYPPRNAAKSNPSTVA